MMGVVAESYASLNIKEVHRKMATSHSLCSSLDSLSKIEAETGKSFDQAVQELAQRSGRREINIVATGKLAAGKSALINGLIGEEVALESDSLDQETHEVQKFSRNIDGISFNVWDSPGIEANTEEETENIENIAKGVEKADLLLFCIRMDESRLRNQDLNTITHFTKAFGEEIWHHTVFALTFANMVVPARNRNDSEAKKRFFEERLQLWKQQLQDALRSADVDREVVEMVKIVPIGYYKEPSLPNGQQNWLTAFWQQCLETMNENAQPALLKVNLNRLRSVQEVPSEDYYLPFYRQPIVIETLRRAAVPGATGIVGGAIGLGVSGPIGMAVGGAIGAVAGYFLQGCAKNYTN